MRMFFATRGLPVLLELGLLIFCVIDIVQTPEGEIRNLSKGVWLLIVIVLPLVGGIAWLVAGRPAAATRRRDVPWPTGPTAGFPEHERPRQAPRGPDDDPEYLAEIARVNREQENTLHRWEEDLRRREEHLRREREADGQDGAPGGSITPA